MLTVHTQSSPRQRRSQAALLVPVTALVLALLPGLAGTSARAVIETDVEVTSTASAGTVLTGDPLSVSGRVTPAPAGAPVALQRYLDGLWQTRKWGQVAADGSYRISISTSVEGSRLFRVYSPADALRQAAASSPFTVDTLACVRSVMPASGVRAWFSRPGGRTASELSQQLGRLFCSAAPGSTVNISMYFINAIQEASEMDAILVPLRRVVRYRGVQVRIMLEGKLYGSAASLTRGLPALQDLATVVMCQRGCLNERALETPGHGILHNKFVTVSDMSWKPGIDPAVVVSSANWSQSQLHNFWQSAVLVYDDPVMYREFEIQWAKMLTCAQTGCASWAAEMTRLGLAPEAYGLTDGAGLWRDTVPAERRGTSGTGRALAFSPWFDRDELAWFLRRYTCTPKHHTVRVAHMFVTGARKNVIDALAQLQDRGCRVQVILRAITDSPLLQSGIDLMRKAGLPVRCAPQVHDKTVLVDAVKTTDGRPDRSLWMGSQSLGGRAVKSNDETLLRVSTAQSTGSAVAANSALWDRFNTQWLALQQRETACA